MPAVVDQIVVPERITECSMERAIAANVDRLLRHGMSRHAFQRELTSASDLNALPILHLLDQRVWLPLPNLSGGTSAEDIDANMRKLRDHLGRMLSINPHPGSRELIGEALRCDPERDSSMIAQAYAMAPSFVRAALRGRLGLAERMQLLSSGDAFEQGTVILSQLLKYHCSLQLQLMTVRGRAIDRLLLRLSPSPSALTEAQVCKELHQVLNAIGQVLRKLNRETRQPPQITVVVERRAAAERAQASMSGTDDEIVADIVAFFRKRRDELSKLTDTLAVLKERATVESLHKSLFGLTSVEALIFGATRLIQLRDISSELVCVPSELKAWIPIQKKNLPPIDDEDVAKVVWVHRSLILRDVNAPPHISSDGRNLDLKAVWEENDTGNLPAMNTAKKRAIHLSQPFMKREKMASPFSNRLKDGQRLDLLPEFFLQKAARVPGALPGSDLLQQVRRRREQEHAHRPPNIRRAPKRTARA